jgi:hypothetical protein
MGLKMDPDQQERYLEKAIHRSVESQGKTGITFDKNGKPLVFNKPKVT